MQRYTRTLIEALRGRKDLTLTVTGYSGGRAGLPFFFIRAFFSAVTFGATGIHLGDAVLSPLLPLIRVLRPGLRRSITVYGLDLKFPSKVYRLMLRYCLPLAGKVVAISQATSDEAKKLGVPPASIVVIPCAISQATELPVTNRNPGGLRLLIFGRQIKRKGSVWFLEEVLPLLLKKFPGLHLTVAGDGYELPAIRAEAAKFSQANVTVYGVVSENERLKLLADCTVFVVPNIPVENDMEGFGITCIEAAAAGLPVVAADLEGLKDAVKDHETGFLFKVRDPHSAAEAIEKAAGYFPDPARIKAACLKHYGTDQLALRYSLDVFA
jgi:phosphatidylinositol alpha-1,6-mannosyltransferase